MRFSKGFTLIELLVVVSIISLLSSIISVSLTSSRARAQDTAKQATLNSVRTAVQSYKLDKNGAVPIPVTGSGTMVVDDGNSTGDFRRTLKPLIDEGYLSGYPSADLGIFYYAVDNEGDDDVVVGATLTTKAPSTGGLPGSCRPFRGATVEAPSYPGATCRLGAPAPEGSMICCQGFMCFSAYIPTQCNNGSDDDGDGKIDYGTGPTNDRGCASLNDNGETPDPEPGSAAYCSTDPNSDYCLCI